MRRNTLKAAILAAIAGTVLQFGCLPLGGLSGSVSTGLGFSIGQGIFDIAVAPLFAGIDLGGGDGT